MGELRRHADPAPRRRSFPSCFERTNVGGGSWNLEQPASATSTKSSTKKTRWSLGGGGTMSGRGVPDIVRVTRYDDDDDIVSRSRRVDDSRKRSRRDQLSDLPDVPAKRVWPVSEHGASSSSVWDCAGLTWPWSGLRRRLSVFRRSSRLPQPSYRRDRQPPARIGKVSL